jgi:hypothetical protein
MKKDLEECQRELVELRAGIIPEQKIYSVLHSFGEAGFVQAKSDVEQYLEHDDSQLRYIALNVLTIHWRCTEHRTSCERFIVNDPDSDNRRLGTIGLGALLQGTRDAEALRLLLNVFSDEDEEWHVRDSAYRAILYILGRPASEQPSAARKMNYATDVNWEYIETARRITVGAIK